MNRQESFQLLTYGREAWNEWAEKMLDLRRALQDAGQWSVIDTPHWSIDDKRERLTPQNAFTQAWFNAVRADFRGCTFPTTNIFDGFIFPGDADFSPLWNNVGFQPARFKSRTCFKKAEFLGETSFRMAQFNGGAGFIGTTFHGSADFERARFEGGARFFKCKFSHDTSFASAEFTDKVEFMRTSFEKLAKFDCARFNTGPDAGISKFKNVEFHGVTSFTRAAFIQTLDLETPLFRGPTIFEDAVVKEHLLCCGATFEFPVHFEGMRIDCETYFANTNFAGAATFDDAAFGGRVQFVDSKFSKDASFSDVMFENDAIFEKSVSASRLVFDGAVFRGRKSLPKRYRHLRLVSKQD